MTYEIFISDELKDILKTIESESLVARLFLKNQHDMVDIVESPANYISISKEDKTKLSYLTKARLSTLNECDYWSASKRFQSKPGSFISKIFKNVSDKDVEKFSNLYKSQVIQPRFTLEIVDGDKIKDFYSHKAYQSQRGSLGNSCMKHDFCQDFFNLYTSNKDIKMLAMLDENKSLMGRALLWNIEGHKIMDRIYTTLDEELQFHFKKWATSNGYLYKSVQNFYDTLHFENMNEEKKELKFKVDLASIEHDKYPYMDTFKFINPKVGQIYNYIPEGQETDIKTLISSDGLTRYDSNYLKFDSIDRVFIYSGESSFLDYLNIYTHQRNVVYSNLNNKCILARDSKYDAATGDHLFAGEYEHLNKKIEVRKVERKSDRLRFRPMFFGNDLIPESDLPVGEYINFPVDLNLEISDYDSPAIEVLDNDSLVSPV